MTSIIASMLAVLCVSSLAEASRPEGFFDIETVQEFSEATKETLQNSIFKIQIGSLTEMHGTAFLISEDGLMLTNVHNLKSCLDTHGRTASGYNGDKGDLECDKLTLIDRENRRLGAVKLVASYPYHVSSGHRVEVAVIRSAAPEVLAQRPLRFSRDTAPKKNLFNVGYAGKTARSVRKIAKQIRNLNAAIRGLLVLESEVAPVDPARVPTAEVLTPYFKYLQKSVPLLSESNFLSGLILPPNLSTWLAMTPENAKIEIVTFVKKTELQMYAYLKMLESLKLTQYRRGFVSYYPDADNTLKSSRAVIASERWPGVWVAQGDARPGSSGSPTVDAAGEVNGIVFAIGLVANEIRSGCTLDVMFSDWESENYASCRNVGFLMVDAKFVLQALKTWGIVIP